MPSRAHPEAVLIKPAEGMSYASILRELIQRFNPDKLDTTVQVIRKTRSKDLLVELKCSKKTKDGRTARLKRQFELLGRSVISSLESRSRSPT